MADKKQTLGENLFEKLRAMYRIVHPEKPYVSEGDKNYAATTKGFLDAELKKYGKTLDQLRKDLRDRAEEAKKQNKPELESFCDWLDPPEPYPPNPAHTYTKADLHAEGSKQILTLLHSLLNKYVHLKPHQYVVSALWPLHTHVYDRFAHTPRLLITAPAHGCAKSLLSFLVASTSTAPWHPHHGGETYVSVTDASVWHWFNKRLGTLCVDEAESLTIEGPLEAVFNGGFQLGGNRLQMDHGGDTASLNLFGPLVISGKVESKRRLKPAFVSRCINIRMTKYYGRDLIRLDPTNPNREVLDLLRLMRGLALDWASTAQLNTDPVLPDWMYKLEPRFRDKWRPLISIADSFGDEWGERARDAALEFSKGQIWEDPGLALLRDIHEIFELHYGETWATFFTKERKQSIWTRDVRETGGLLSALHERMPWNAWTGIKGNADPHPLTENELAGLLGAFDIQAKSIWRHYADDTRESHKGHNCDMFEQAWADYCGNFSELAQPRPTPLASAAA